MNIESHSEDALSSSSSSSSSPSSSGGSTIRESSPTNSFPSPKKRQTNQNPNQSQSHRVVQRHTTQIVLETCSAQSVLNSVIAGYAAGVSGTLVGHPFDSLKVWMQTRDVPSSAKAPPPPPPPPPTATISTSPSTVASSSVSIKNQSTALPPTSTTTTATAAAHRLQFSAVATQSSSPQSLLERYIYGSSNAISWQQRTRALYAGMTGPLLTVGLIQSINFAIYDSCRRILYGLEHEQHNELDYLHHDAIRNVAAAAAMSGIVLCVVTNPLMIIKVKQQISPQWTFRRAVLDTIRPYGGHNGNGSFSARTAFVGFPLHACSEIIGRVVYYASYEALKRRLFAYRRNPHESPCSSSSSSSPYRPISSNNMSLSSSSSSSSSPPPLPMITLPERMTCAAISGIVTWSIIFPIDAVRSRLFAQNSTAILNGQAVSIVRMAQSIYAQHGWRGYFRGYAVTVLRAGPVAAAVLPIYDMTLEYLSGLSSV